MASVFLRKIKLYDWNGVGDGQHTIFLQCRQERGRVSSEIFGALYVGFFLEMEHEQFVETVRIPTGAVYGGRLMT
jgi:hypothetical protein